MPQITAEHIRLRSVYVPATSSKHKKLSLLKYRKPLTSHLKRKMKIGSFQFKHHYTSGNELLLDLRDISKNA